jgi:NAD(P)-dependent dehydrogenase (short-subunit alcohol dehydrogenase family)
MAMQGVAKPASLEGKVGFVTGAASGIGKASARALARAGARLMLVDVSAPALEATRSELAGGGAEVATSVVDVADPDAVSRAVAQTVERFGGLQLAHNNAGLLGPFASLANYPLDAARRLFDVNVFGVLHCLQAQIRAMLAGGGGSIVNTASVSGVRALPNIGIYTATKHAVIGLTKAAAREYSARGIRVNCVCPGFVLTDMTKGRFDAETEAALAAQHPIGRFADPAEIAETVLWLLGESASFVTGSAVFVDGGQTV